MADRARRLFIAGASGATGKLVVERAKAIGVGYVAHARPKEGRVPVAGEAVFALEDRPALVAALRECTTVVQLIGTIRQRFASGDTYESSDIGTTRLLVDAAKEAGIDHLVLLSSVGAGRPVGAYLQAKAAAEAIVRDSGIAWTTLRPSAFMGDRHHVPGAIEGAMKLLHLHRYRPIHLEDLAKGIVQVAATRAPLGVAIEGRALWDVVDVAKR